MKRILLPNLFFEEELQSIATTGSAKAQRLVADLGPAMGLLGMDDTFLPEVVVADSRANIRNNRTIVLVEDKARPEQLPSALQHVEFLTLKEWADVLRNEPRVLTDPTEEWQALPWGWSEAARSTLSYLPGRKIENDQQALTPNAPEMRATHILAPDINAVRFINSRQFQAAFDVANEMDGEGRIDAFGTLCRSVAEVQTAIKFAADFSPRGWVIKADLSHASRNRLLGNGTELRREHRAWLDARFANGECVYVEPWVERIGECGLQFQITPSSATPSVEFIGAAEMLTDDVGSYRGSVVGQDQTPDSPHNELWQPAIEHGQHVARAAGAEGYLGPIGFDCMVFRHPQRGSRWLRLSHDINGRLTMGRVALSLKTLLEPDEKGVWLHTSENSLQQSCNGSDDIPHKDVRIERTSPGLIGGKPAKTVTAFVVSGNSEQLQAASSRILGQTVKMPISRL